MELTRSEERIAKMCSKKYQGFMARHGNLIGWLGVPLFALGILRVFSLSEWLRSLFLAIGFFMIFLGMIESLVSLIGKLYVRIQELAVQQCNRVQQCNSATGDVHKSIKVLNFK